MFVNKYLDPYKCSFLLQLFAWLDHVFLRHLSV